MTFDGSWYIDATIESIDGVVIGGSSSIRDRDTNGGDGGGGDDKLTVRLLWNKL